MLTPEEQAIVDKYLNSTSEDAPKCIPLEVQAIAYAKPIALLYVEDETRSAHQVFFEDLKKAYIAGFESGQKEQSKLVTGLVQGITLALKIIASQIRYSTGVKVEKLPYATNECFDRTETKTNPTP